MNPPVIKLGKYEILGEIGHGGFAVAYRAGRYDAEQQIGVRKSRQHEVRSLPSGCLVLNLTNQKREIGGGKTQFGGRNTVML
jgi:hypothetical protein